MKEWEILKESLPESIYVRVYEGRIDLLRAVIIGAAGTPYHNGLFFFDFQFPSDYPNKPPSPSILQWIESQFDFKWQC
ncbi:Ubiquitin-conjugating enzyme [Macleaya cordata]|uniref:Ubiquitin-conjugating enzyme n=1 Tax=Macleaya cordata TaxID=56857 RepID=A0A200QU07_MACCD|nr:Ubiquitin-conjugating enzyme [Macleaya cordata]